MLQLAQLSSLSAPQVDFFAYTYEQSMPNYKNLQVAFDRVDIRRVRLHGSFKATRLRCSAMQLSLELRKC